MEAKGQQEGLFFFLKVGALTKFPLGVESQQQTTDRGVHRCDPRNVCGDGRPRTHAEGCWC